MANMSEVVVGTIDKYREKLNSVSQTIWKNPELYYREVKAHDYLSQALEDEGFQVQRKYHLDTAFRAEYSVGSDCCSWNTGRGKWRWQN
uniref:M20 domain containing peptidase n=1 Tax=Rhipicephalus appendiculatus TaxID=34631 RepID=A0A131Z4Z4_RHIAP